VPDTSELPRHVLTVALEDYFHVGAFNRLIQRGQWHRFECRLERNTRATLDLLDECGQRATFFVLGWVADQMPELVRAVAERGHEVASKGYYHRNIRQMTPGEFRDDLARSRESIEAAAGRRVLGYRVADRWFGPEDLWALEVLAEEGYLYDSSIAPFLRRFAGDPWRRMVHSHRAGDHTIWELPISSARFLGFDLPIAGGNYLRQLPKAMVRRAVRNWDLHCPAPLVMYFHVWELDPDQPKISAAPLLQRVRQYRHLGRMPRLRREYLTNYRFTTAAEQLGAVPEQLVNRAPGNVPAAWSPPPAREPASWVASDATPVTVVIPCYNEELMLPDLSNTLAHVQQELRDRYDLRFLFVDDGSSDGTWDQLQQVFGNRPDCRLVRHDQNKGVAAALMTGIARADTDIVCSIDCDCTYDPLELGRMIPLLEDGVDLVTASPYHPEGMVRNVPGWRLFLSRQLSHLYRAVLHHKLHTYTSCFRVYRRSAMVGIDIEEPGFLGVAELLGRLDLSGGTIVEFPATLEVRMLGRSKMKIVRTILGHLRLLAHLLADRLATQPPAPHTDPRPDTLQHASR
jgi:polysaccharide deacetylase family protein (PEP-CTERM system associated)